MSLLLQILLFLALITLASKGAGTLSTRFGQPAVFGEILAGLVLGPSLLNILGWSLFAPTADGGSGRSRPPGHPAHDAVLRPCLAPGPEVLRARRGGGLGSGRERAADGVRGLGGVPLRVGRGVSGWRRGDHRLVHGRRPVRPNLLQGEDRSGHPPAHLFVLRAGLL